MANDRLRIVCKYCKESVMLFKYYPCGGYVNDEDILDEFIKKHLCDCHPCYGHAFMDNEPGFFLETESKVIFQAD